MHGSPPSERILLHGSGVWARYNSAMRAIEAVVFDIGGVVQESPLHAIARYERDHGLPPGAINRAVVAAGEAGAWARLERGELTVESFLAPFAADCRAWGVEVDGGRWGWPRSRWTTLRGRSASSPRSWGSTSSGGCYN